MIQEGNKEGAKIMVFPELCLTAYTCGDLFLQDELLKRTREELEKLIDENSGDGHADFHRTSLAEGRKAL